MTAPPPEPDSLSRDDAAILALESEAIAGHTLKLVLLEPGGEPLDLEALRASVAKRLAGEPRGLERIEIPDGDPAAAAWVRDQRFEIGAHVRRRGPIEGLDEAGLWREASKLMSERLDHERPLWAFELVGPLADGREAVVARIHHAMADGISSVRFLEAVLFDQLAEPAPTAGHPHAAARGAVRAPAAELPRLAGALVRGLGHRSRSSVLDRSIGARRALAFAAAPLAELKRIGAARPARATVNDVLLAVVAGGLREWLPSVGGRAAGGLRAQVPVSLHHRDADPAGLGNRDSFLNVELPLAEPDPVARLDAINAETARRKQLGDAEELYDFFHALGRFKHLSGAAERLAAGPREFGLSISNVPGPRTEVAVLGRRVERLSSVAEPAARHALRVSAISCAGSVSIGLCTDPDALADVAGLAAAIERSLAELGAASGAA